MKTQGLFAVPIFLVVVSCGPPQKPVNQSIQAGILPSQPPGYSEKPVPDDLMTFTADPEASEEDTLVRTADLDEHFFGSFYSDRADFYVIDDPQNSIFNSKIEQLTLYYIDGTLCKTKYMLAQNIGMQLVRNYGSFKIIGCDSVNKAIIARGSVMEGKVLNEGLNNYEMSWSLNNKVYEFRVDTRTAALRYQFIEKIKNYEWQLKRLNSPATVVP